MSAHRRRARIHGRLRHLSPSHKQRGGYQADNHTREQPRLATHRHPRTSVQQRHQLHRHSLRHSLGLRLRNALQRLHVRTHRAHTFYRAQCLCRHIRWVLIFYIEIPGSIKTIPKRAFAHATKTRNIVIGEGVERIEQEAFAQNGSQIWTPYGYTHEGVYDFTLPSTVSYIGSGAFKQAELLQGIYVYSATPQRHPPCSLRRTSSTERSAPNTDSLRRHSHC